jgi:hypothetical protein
MLEAKSHPHLQLSWMGVHALYLSRVEETTDWKSRQDLLLSLSLSLACFDFDSASNKRVIAFDLVDYCIDEERVHHFYQCSNGQEDQIATRG